MTRQGSTSIRFNNDDPVSLFPQEISTEHFVEALSSHLSVRSYPDVSWDSGSAYFTSETDIASSNIADALWVYGLLRAIGYLQYPQENPQAHVERNAASEQDNWVLDNDQMIFMLQHHNEIESAFDSDDIESLRDLASSDEYKAVFGEMSIDEAYDRYECMIEETRDATSMAS